MSIFLIVAGAICLFGLLVLAFVIMRIDLILHFFTKDDD